MKLKEMNEALQGLREKYAVSANGELVASAAGSWGAAAELVVNGKRIKLLPWRVERRFIELKKLVDGKTLEDVSTLRFASMVSGGGVERLLYRELDGLDSDTQVEDFRRRMQDRFGEIPEEGEELIRVVALRRLGRRFGSERIVLKDGRMRLFFVKNPQSAFYQSRAFGQLIDYATVHTAHCRLAEHDGRRTMLVHPVGSVRQAVELLQQVSKIE